MTDQLSPMAARDYLVDSVQRTAMFLDVLRPRTEQSEQHNTAEVPHVLSFEADLVCDGRTLPRPVNYLLARVRPPAGVTVDPLKRPFVVIDPRAGHGPGIGGSRPTARSASPSARAIPATSWASCPTRSPARPSRISPMPKRISSNW